MLSELVQMPEHKLEELTNRTPTHVESRSKDVYHSQSSDTRGRRMITLSRLRAEAEILTA